jgi:3-deoxy-D-manno-octulosonic-acid transferase
MRFIYTLAVNFYTLLIKFASLFNAKACLWTEGRKVQRIQEVPCDKKVVWMHCASSGEFEQGRTLLELIAEQHPDYYLVVSFFSPSGYEMKKNYPKAHQLIYFPDDSNKSVKDLMQKLHPDLFILVKYEFWYNLLQQLNFRQSRVILIGGIFREKQHFFRFYGEWFRKHLKIFDYLFLQDEYSAQLLSRIGINRLQVCGDPRFDRVKTIAEQKTEEIIVIQNFVRDTFCVVAGSTWPEDEERLLAACAQVANEVMFSLILVPHEINPDSIQRLKNSVDKYRLSCCLFSEMESKPEKATGVKVMIFDKMGYLSRLYRYAQLAYVGGGFGKGIHNTLEAAVYQVPVITGPNIRKFKEARDMRENGILHVVDEAKEISALMLNYYQNPDLRKQVAEKAAGYFAANFGASEAIYNTLKEKRLLP